MKLSSSGDELSHAPIQIPSGSVAMAQINTDKNRSPVDVRVSETNSLTSVDKESYETDQSYTTMSDSKDCLVERNKKRKSDFCSLIDALPIVRNSSEASILEFRLSELPSELKGALERFIRKEHRFILNPKMTVQLYAAHLNSIPYPLQSEIREKVVQHQVVP